MADKIPRLSKCPGILSRFPPHHLKNHGVQSHIKPLVEQLIRHLRIHRIITPPRRELIHKNGRIVLLDVLTDRPVNVNNLLKIGDLVEMYPAEDPPASRHATDRSASTSPGSADNTP